MPADGKMPGTVPQRADTPAGQPLAWLLSQSHLARPGDVTAVLAEAVRSLGLSGPRVYLADMQQRHLMPLPEDSEAASQGRAAAEPLSIESTTAGRAYRTVAIQHDPAVPASQAGTAA